MSSITDSFNQVKSGATGFIKKIWNLPDRIDAKKHPMRAKMAYIAMDVAVMGIGGAFLYLPQIMSGVTSGFSHGIAANPLLQFETPDPMKMMMLAPTLLAGGFGLSCLVEDLTGTESDGERGRIHELVSFLFMLTAGGFITASGCSSGTMLSSVCNQYTWVGLLLGAFSFSYFDSRKGM